MALAEKLGLEGYMNGFVLTILGSLTAALILFAVAMIVWLGVRDTKRALVPSKRVSIQNMIEVLIEALTDLLTSIMGNKAEKFLPLIGTLFIYIFICNMLGFIPGLISPTTTLTANFGCAIIVFLYYNYIGIREHGFFRYFKHFAGPVFWLAPFIFCIEMVTHLVRPFSLSFRLFGNVYGDEMVVDIFSGLVPLFLPVVFIFLGFFVAIVQAFIFSILSSVYISLAVQEE